MNMEEFATFELEPLRTDTYRRAETGFRETLLGKRNRISIGHPVVIRLEQPTFDGLLTEADFVSFSREGHDFWSVELSLSPSAKMGLISS